MKFDIMKRKYLIRLIMVCKDFIGCLFSFVNKNFVQFVLFSFFGGADSCFDPDLFCLKCVR